MTNVSAFDNILTYLENENYYFDIDDDNNISIENEVNGDIVFYYHFDSNTMYIYNVFSAQYHKHPLRNYDEIDVETLLELADKRMHEYCENC